MKVTFKYTQQSLTLMATIIEEEGLQFFVRKLGKYEDAHTLGIAKNKVIEALSYVSERDMSKHYDVLGDVCDRLKPDAKVVDPDILVVEHFTGGMTSECDDDYRLPVVISPTIYLPRKIEDDDKALTGFYAHEISHLCVWDAPQHKRWIKEMDRWAQPNLLTLLPALYMFRFVLPRMAFDVEEMVDRFARNHGYSEEIDALRDKIN